jgi:branched-chain amino acid aminotransferase
MNFSHFSKNGQVKSFAEAVVPLSNIEYQYGFGVYETMRVKNGVVFFIKEHIERLLNSAEIIGLPHVLKAQQVCDSIQELVSKVVEPVFNLKILLIGGKTPEEAELCILPLAPLFPDKKLYRDGAVAVTYPYERLFPKAKTLNMLGSFLAYRSARAIAGYDALLVNRAGYITEGTRTNFFAIRDKAIFEAPNAEVLDGVTRRHVLQVAKEQGFSFKEARISPGDLKDFDGAFVTSTSSKIVPLSKVDDFSFPVIAPQVKDLIESFDRFLKQYEENVVRR